MKKAYEEKFVFHERSIDEKKIKIHKDLYKAKEDIKNSSGDIYAVLNFDYVNDFNRVMEEIKWK